MEELAQDPDEIPPGSLLGQLLNTKGLLVYNGVAHLLAPRGLGLLRSHSHGHPAGTDS